MAKPKLYVALGIQAPRFLSVLEESFNVEVCPGKAASHEELLASLPGKDALFCFPGNKVDKKVIEAAGPSLKVMATISAGYEHIDIEECKKRKIKVGFLGNVVSEVMGEFTIGLMIAVGRRFPEAIKDFRDGNWGKKSAFEYMNGIDIDDSVVGLVGFGCIGQAIAKRLQPFGTKKILYCGPHKKAEGELLHAEYVSFETLLKESDFVVASCTVNDTTRKMFNNAAFKQMKPTSIFINISRGDVVDQDALYEALKNKHIWAAGIDVTTPEPFPLSNPLASLDNCVILPHIGTSSVKLREKMFKMTYLNLVAASKGEKMPIPLLE